VGHARHSQHRQADERLLAGELREALRRRSAMQLRGRWYVVSPELAHHTLRVLLTSCAEHGWPRSNVPGVAAVAALQEDDIDPTCGLNHYSS